VHNQVLLARATKRYELSAVQKTVPNHKTPEATADFFDAFAKTVREAGHLGQMKTSSENRNRNRSYRLTENRKIKKIIK